MTPAPRFPCPCCGHLTLNERASFEICEVCDWEDDGQDDADADIVRGGPNGGLSLTAARAAFTAANVKFTGLAGQECKRRWRWSSTRHQRR